MEAITLDELLQALEEASGGPAGEGFTVGELREVKPMGLDKARELVRRGIRKGLVRPSRKMITDISGRVQAVPSYVFVKRKRTRL